MSGKIEIALNGPELNAQNAAYGGGVGGYVRNMHSILTKFQSESIDLVPIYNSVRKKGKYYRFLLIFRAISDVIQIYRKLKGKQALHILGQYRGAVYREYLATWIACCLKVPILYEIKAGQFISWYQNSNYFQRYLIGRVIKRSNTIACEGKVYLDFVANTFQRKAVYLPNFVDEIFISSDKLNRKLRKPLRILFVGYCYEGKGVYQLVSACESVSKLGIPITLTLVGQEEDGFSNYLDKKEVKFSSDYQVKRLGVKHDVDLRKQYANNDVFVMASKHEGEGHTNTINEAMVNQMVIISSKNGFLGDILNEQTAYFVEDITALEIEKNIHLILNDEDEALQKAKLAKEIAMENYTSIVVLKELELLYKKMV